MKNRTESSLPSGILRAKLSDYSQLIKVRLSVLVVFSASMAYLWATNRQVDARIIWLLSIGGFLITGAANVLNQVIEKDSDKLMKRTAKRPLPGKRMNNSEALIFAIVFGIGGFVTLYAINPLCAFTGLLALILYAAVYTPMKKISSFAVVPGAVAGSLPVVIGCTAASGEITREALLLFLIQFIWQFPHTWSIAWLLNDEYNKAGIRMLPVKGKSKFSAVLIIFSTFLIIPAGFLLYNYQSAGMYVASLLSLAGLMLLIFSFRLYRKKTDRSAVGLMLGSFVYLPFVLIILVLEKFL